MVEKNQVWLQHNNKEGYKVFITNERYINLCVTPKYLTYERARLKLRRYVVNLRYNDRGILREGDCQ